MTMFEKQTQHYLLLIGLLFGVYFLSAGDVLSGQLWGMGTQTWFWIAIVTPVLHQIVVALLWVIVFAFLSKVAFCHVYIWVHYYFTELPDICHIYGSPSKERV